MSRLKQLAINDEGFAFDPSSGESFTINPTGLFILQGLRELKQPTEICANLTEAFDTTPESAERDVADFMAQLRTLKLI